MKPCSVSLYLVFDRTKVLWLRPCFGIVVCCFGEQVFKIHVRPKQASVPLRHAPLLCQHSVVEGLWEGGGGVRRKLGMPLYSGGLLYGLAPLCGPWPRPPRQLFRGTNGRGVPLLITTPLCRSLRRGRSGLGEEDFKEDIKVFLFFSFPLLTAQVESHLCLLLQVVSMLCLDA